PLICLLCLSLHDALPISSPVTPATAPSWRNPLPPPAPPSPLVNPKPRQPCPAFTKTATVTFSLPDSRSPPTPTHSCPTRATSTPCASSPTPSAGSRKSLSCSARSARTVTWRSFCRHQPSKSTRSSWSTAATSPPPHWSPARSYAQLRALPRKPPFFPPSRSSRKTAAARNPTTRTFPSPRKTPSPHTTWLASASPLTRHSTRTPTNPSVSTRTCSTSSPASSTLNSSSTPSTSTRRLPSSPRNTTSWKLAPVSTVPSSTTCRYVYRPTPTMKPLPPSSAKPSPPLNPLRICSRTSQARW